MGHPAESSPRHHERHGKMVDLLITNVKMRRMDRVALAARSVAESAADHDDRRPVVRLRRPGISGAIESLPPARLII
jgi:hypothetical protein